MKTFATYALMAAAMAVKLQMLQEETDKPETKRVEDMDKDDFSPEELECISMAVEGGLREKGMEGEELEATKERFHAAAEEGATLGEGVDELRKMGKEADMSEGEIDETLEKMFDRAHKCGEKKKERKEKEAESEGEGETLAQKMELNSEDEADLKELMGSTAADLGEKKLRCLGESIKEGLKAKGMPAEEADAAVEVLAGGARDGKKVEEGVDYLRTLGEEAGLDTDDQDEVLLGMAGKARECAEKSSDDEEEAALAQQDSEPASEGPKSDWDSADAKSEGTWSEKGSWDSEEDVSESDSWSAKSEDWSAKSGDWSAKSGDWSAKSLEMAQEDDMTDEVTEEAEESESDGEGPSEDGEESRKGGRSDKGEEDKEMRGDKGEEDKEMRGDKGEGDKEERKGGDKKGGRRGDKKEDDGAAEVEE